MLFSNDIAPGDAENVVPSLTISDLRLSYGSFEALKGIDLEIARGEFVALLGPSGCGKTSLLRCIAGFNQPTGGSIALSGTDLTKVPTRNRNIGFLFQSYALFPDMTIEKNVRFGLDCRGVARSEAAKRVQDALELVGLSNLATRYPRQLSGGQQQRVALARAIVIQPDILLLDEPLSALDKQLRQRMQTELKELQRSLGITAVFVTHDQEEALTMADRIVVMRNGEIRQIADPEALFSAPSDAWVCEFVNAGNLYHGKVETHGDDMVGVRLGDHSSFRARRVEGLDPADSVIFSPYHAVKAHPAPSGTGLKVAAVRYLGLAAELQIPDGDNILRVQVPVAQAHDFPVGSFVTLSADPDDCGVLPLGGIAPTGMATP